MLTRKHLRLLKPVIWILVFVLTCVPFTGLLAR